MNDDIDLIARFYIQAGLGILMGGAVSPTATAAHSPSAGAAGVTTGQAGEDGSDLARRSASSW